MKPFVILCNSSTGPDDLPVSAIVAHWDDVPLPEGHVSIPGQLGGMLLRIRAEHMRWAYDMGYVDAGKGSRPLWDFFMRGERPSMWWISLLYERHPRLSPFLYEIYKLRCAEILILDGACDELWLFGATSRLENTLADFCAVAGLKFSASDARPEKPEARPSWVARAYAATPAPVRALARFCHWWWKIRRKLPFCRDVAALPPSREVPQNSRTATIATYFPNIDMPAAAKGDFRSNYWQDLHEALNAQAMRERPDGPHFARWLFIRFPSPQANFSECLALRDAFRKSGRDGFSFHYLEEFLTAGDILGSLSRWFKLWLSSARVEGDLSEHFHFKGSKINFWIYMREQWRESFQGWRCLERCLQNRAFKRYARMTGAQRWTLFPLENCPWERMLTLAVRSIKDNGKVIGAQHSTIRPTDFRYFDDPRAFANPVWSAMQPDLICGNGQSAIGQWRQNGMPEERLRQVEALRYLYLAAEDVPPDRVAWQNEIPPEPGEPLEMVAPHHLLVLTSFFADETAAHLRLLGRALAAGFFEGWSISIKPHPYLAVEEWVNAQDARWQKQITIVDGPLALALRPGVAVWASNSTTAALEAAIRNLRLMVMLPHNDFDLCPIQNVPGLLRTGTLADTEYALQHLRKVNMGPDYLDLDVGLPAWRKILGLGGPVLPE